MESRTLYVEHTPARTPRSLTGALLVGFWLLAGLSSGGVARAESPAAQAVVEQVQWPVWIDRAGGRQALAAGAVLRSGDTVVTGDQARAVIRLADGSAVKLGEQAQLAVDRLGEKAPGVLDAGLAVAKGAFRFTTGLFRQLVPRREVAVRFPTLTIGVRGTDFWGKSDGRHEMVLLLEGQIAVAGAGEAAGESRRLAEPFGYLIAETGRAFAERRASAEEIRGWAAETEPQAGRAGGVASGKHVATALGALTRPAADAAAARLQALGYPVRVSAYAPATVAGRDTKRSRFAVTLAGLGSRSEAQRMREVLRQALAGAGAMPAPIAPPGGSGD